MSSLVTMEHPADLTCPSVKYHMLVADCLWSWDTPQSGLNHLDEFVHLPLHAFLLSCNTSLSSSNHLILFPSSPTGLQTTLNTSLCFSPPIPWLHAINMPPSHVSWVLCVGCAAPAVKHCRWYREEDSSAKQKWINHHWFPGVRQWPRFTSI